MYNIGDKFERKNYEYEIVAKVKHESKDEHVYLVKSREFGEDDVDYIVFDEFAFSAYKKIS